MLNNILKWCLYSYVIIIPLIYFKGVESVFSIPKLTSIKYITAILLLSLVIKIYKEKKIEFIKNKFNILLLIYAFISILTVVFSSRVYTSIFGIKGMFQGIITLLNYLLLTFCAFQFLTKENIIKIIYLSVFTANMASLIGILQHYNILHSENWSVAPGERAFSTFEHGNHFAAYIVFNLFLLFAAFFQINSKTKKYLLLIFSLFLYVPAIIFSGSRGALLALILSLFCSMIFFIFQNKKVLIKYIQQNKKIIIYSGIIVVIISIFSIIFFNSFYSKISKLPLVSRSVETIRFIQDGNIPDRVSWYLSSLSMIKDKPILGYGLSTFKDNYNQYRRLDYVNPHESQDNVTPENAHNEYLTKAVEQGIIGLSIYLFLIFYVFLNKNSIKFLHNESREKYTYLFILTAIASYLFQVSLSFGVISTLTLFYLFLGIAVKYPLSEESENIKKIHLNKAKLITLSLLMIFISFYLIHFGNKQFKAEYYSLKANIAFGKAQISNTFAYSEKMIEYMPKEYEYHRIYGDFLYQISAHEQDLEKALEYLKKAELQYIQALKINSDFPQLHANLGLIHFLQYLTSRELMEEKEAKKYLRSTKASYETSIKFSPNNPLYTYNYAKLLMQIEDYNNAIIYFEKTFEIRPDYPGLAYHLAASYYLVADYEKAIKVLEYSIAHSTANQDQIKLYEGIKKILNN